LAGIKPASARVALALAKSKGYRDAADADAEATLRVSATDVANFEVWCFEAWLHRHAGDRPPPRNPAGRQAPQGDCH
jgi:hypothetical protein